MIWQFIKLIWNLLSQFSGVVSTIGMVSLGILWFLNYISTNFPQGYVGRVVIVVLILMTVISLRFILDQIQKGYRRFINEKQKVEVKESFEALEKQKPENRTLVLPNNKQLKLWDSYAKKIAKEWTEDAEYEYMSVWIGVGKSRINVSPQIKFHSKWKSQELTVFPGGNLSMTMKEEKELIENVQKHSPLFVRYTNWHWAVQKAYEQIESSLDDVYEIWLHSHYSVFHFCFDFNRGGIKKRYEFDFDGRFLNSKDGRQFGYKR